MKMTKWGKYLTTVPASVWFLADKLDTYCKKRKNVASADTIAQIERLYDLKKCGAISEEEYGELKEHLKTRIN